MTELEKAFAAIQTQQEKLKPFNPAYCLGEQLKAILEDQPQAAAIVLEDLKNPGMKITDCEKKIADFAKAHKVGNCGCCPPQEADKIIREFYGIPAARPKIIGVDFAQGRDFTVLPGREPAPAPKPKAKKVNLATFMK